VALGCRRTAAHGGGATGVAEIGSQGTDLSGAWPGRETITANTSMGSGARDRGRKGACNGEGRSGSPKLAPASDSTHVKAEREIEGARTDLYHDAQLRWRLLARLEWRNTAGPSSTSPNGGGLR